MPKINENEVANIIRDYDKSNIAAVRCLNDSIHVEFFDINKYFSESKEFPHKLIFQKLADEGIRIDNLDYHYEAEDTIRLFETQSKTPQNKTLTHDKTSPSSNLEIFWKCKNGHSYQAKISDRSYKGVKCPTCGL